MQDRSGLGPRDASSYAREYARGVDVEKRRRRRGGIGRRWRAAWRAWRDAGAAGDA